MKLSELIVDENGVVKWEELKEKMGDIYPLFEKWLYGQTVTPKGAFISDVERFISGLPVVD